MSLYGVMRTSVSGMNAQANRLSTVAENVANVNTTGYKSVSCEFSSLLLTTCPGDYESGAVNTSIRRQITTQGSLINTTSVTDLAISGNGFFIVGDASGTPYLTRAGAFVPNGDGELVNAAGFSLMGYRLDPDQPPITVNGYTNLTVITLADLALNAAASTSGTFTANLPSAAAVVAPGSLPADNVGGSIFTAKSSLVTYDSLGGEVLLDIYFTKTATSEWEVTVFNKADEASGGGFPYASGPLATDTLIFDPSTGTLDGSSPNALSIPVPGGLALDLDFSQMSQLAADYVVVSASVDGNPPSSAEIVEITRDGFVYATYENGARLPVYRIPLAQVASPDMLTPLPGNVFSTTSDSGDVQVGFAQSAAFGEIVSNALEQSNVDLAGELTAMIDAQRSYSANSKVFQTGSELMDVLVNLKR